MATLYLIGGWEVECEITKEGFSVPEEEILVNAKVNNKLTPMIIRKNKVFATKGLFVPDGEPANVFANIYCDGCAVFFGRIKKEDLSSRVFLLDEENEWICIFDWAINAIELNAEKSSLTITLEQKKESPSVANIEIVELAKKDEEDSALFSFPIPQERPEKLKNHDFEVDFSTMFPSNGGKIEIEDE